MRLDKFLKVSRLIKRRTVANEACDAGRVSVNGKPAKASVQVKAGDVLVEADLDAIRDAGYDTATMMILTNADDYASTQKAEPGQVDPSSIVMKIEKA